MNHKKFPNAYLVGCPKSATSAIAAYLSEHPQFYMSSTKELFFWSEDYPRAKERVGLTDLASYERCFAKANPSVHIAAGEGTTSYLQSKVAIKSALDYNTSSKFLAVLRNPVDVAYAMHGELIRHFLENELDFEKAWSLQDPRKRGENLPPRLDMEHQLQYREVVAFFPQIRRFFDTVPPDQRLVLFYEDFVQDPKCFYGQVLDFFGLPNDRRTDFPIVNQARAYKFPLLAKLYQSPPMALEPAMKLVRSAYAANKNWLSRTVEPLMTEPRIRAKLRPEFRRALVEEFATEVSELETLFGRDLSSWKR